MIKKNKNKKEKDMNIFAANIYFFMNKPDLISFIMKT